MSSFHVKSLSDEDVSRMLDTCTTPLVLDRRTQIWRCPDCGQQIHARELKRQPESHLRPGREQVVA